MPDSGPHAQAASDQGMLRGRHYTDYLDEVKTLRREGMDSAAATLLAKLVTAAESEAQARGWDVAPWYYAQLAIIFRKRNDLDAEIAILERYAAQPRSSAQTGAALRRRLQKARALRERR